MALIPALDIARRALLAQEAALGVAGHNIANVNTPGYTRQIPDFEAEPGRSSSGVLIGNGVRLASVIQVVDPLLARRRLGAETDRGEQTALRDRIGELAAVGNDLTQPSLATALDGFFDAADALARNPAGIAERQTLLGRAAALATAFNERSAGIAHLQRAADDRIVARAGEVNDNLAKIATLNRLIETTEIASGQPANDLRDQRQTALNALAGAIAITTVTDDRGALTVSSAAGPVLVQSGTVVHQIAIQTGAPGLDNTVLHDLGLTVPGGGFLAVPQVFAHGELGGLLAARDGKLPTASSNLDTLAGALRDAVNAIQTDPLAVDLNGNGTTGAPLLTGTGAADLAVAISDPAQIGAALSPEAGDNQNALRLADLRTTTPQAVAPSSPDAVAVGSVTLSQYVAGELGRVGEDALRANDAAVASELVTQQLETQRAALSGVNLDEELTNLIKYQRSFQAAAQLLNVTNAVLDELLRVV